MELAEGVSSCDGLPALSREIISVYVYVLVKFYLSIPFLNVVYQNLPSKEKKMAF